MSSELENKSIYRALTTVNAPRALQIEAETLAACLRLECNDRKWRPHMRAFFDEVDRGIILDLVIEGATSFRDLDKGLGVWEAGDSENARWIREMATVPMA
ncbi:hypothetical protein [Rhizobium sp. LjRoot254]|uniref:hypothetical protein n=1 Tax=Rhizobium sp. LjRoot254 TaxID=3342297 RepID=UPI003ECEF994